MSEAESLSLMSSQANWEAVGSQPQRGMASAVVMEEQRVELRGHSPILGPAD